MEHTTRGVEYLFTTALSAGLQRNMYIKKTLGS